MEDIPQLASLWRELSDMHAAIEPMWETVGNALEKHQEHLKVILAKDSYHIVVAEDRNSIIGFSTISLGKRPDVFLKTSIATIQDTYVKPEFRKKGIGRKMTNALIDFAKERNVEMISLSVALANEDGTEFWKSAGFRPILNYMTMYLV